MTLGERIAANRKAQGMTQEQLAEKMGVSPQAVSKWENDQSCPDVLALPKLAGLLKITTDALLSDAPAPETSYLPAEQRKKLEDMMLRVIVNSADGDKVRVNLPFALVKMGIEIGMTMPEINGKDVLKGIDWNLIMQMINNGMIGQLVEVESSDGDTVKVVVE